MTYINLHEYNEISKLTLLSTKASKSARQIKKRINNSYLGLLRIRKEVREAKLAELLKREEEIKAENPKYRKKTLKELKEELKPKVGRLVNGELVLEREPFKSEEVLKKSKARITLNEELKERIEKGNIKDGTYNPITGKEARHIKGYYVGIEPTDLNNPNFKQGQLLGTWTDKGKLYIDKTEHIKDLDEAIGRAKARGEIAIWDIKNKKEIRI